jgi:hypothetical protein
MMNSTRREAMGQNAWNANTLHSDLFVVASNEQYKAL